MLNPKRKELELGRSCKICGRYQANEKFSGKGHKVHICKVCKKLPKEKLTRILQINEITGFLDQSHISPKNMKRLRELSLIENCDVAERAQLVMEVAEFHPHKKRRLKMLSQKRSRLLYKLKEKGLIFSSFGTESVNSTIEVDDNLSSDDTEDPFDFSPMGEDFF